MNVSFNTPTNERVFREDGYIIPFPETCVYE